MRISSHFLKILLPFICVSFLSANQTQIQNEGDFYLLEGKIAQDKVLLYLEMQKIKADQYTINAKFSDSESYFSGQIWEQNLTFVLSDEVRMQQISGKVTWDKKHFPVLETQLGDQEVKFLPATQKLNTLKFARIEFKEKKNIQENSTSREITYKLEDEIFFIPKSLINPNIRNKINAVLTQNAKNFADAKYQVEEKHLKQKIQDENLIFNAEYAKFFNVDYLDEKILSFKITNYQYLGGAHGNSEICALSFSLQDGQILSNKSQDLFKDVNDPALQKLILDALAKYDQSEDVSRFLEWGGESKSMVALPEEFYLNEKGIKFIWQPYEIASYSDGFISVILEFEVLKPFIKTNSPFMYLFQK